MNLPHPLGWICETPCDMYIRCYANQWSIVWPCVQNTPVRCEEFHHTAASPYSYSLVCLSGRRRHRVGLNFLQQRGLSNRFISRYRLYLASESLALLFSCASTSTSQTTNYNNYITTIFRVGSPFLSSTQEISRFSPSLQFLLSFTLS